MKLPKIIRNAVALFKAAPMPVYENRGGWFPLIRESWTGAWQHNATPLDQNTLLSYHAVYACITLIASDIAKLRMRLVMEELPGIWGEATSPAYSPVLRKPNNFQTRIQFWESWMLSKLIRGNTYVLKARDGRGIVTKLFVLSPDRVKPLVADDGSVFYELAADNMAGGELGETVTVPASEIIHDRFNCLFHPLIGTSPIYAAGVAATQGINIQGNSAWFFKNKSQPGGILTAPGHIGDDTATRIKDAWETKFSGENAGRVAVLGDGLKYEPLAMTAQESQLIEQLKWTSEVVCSAFHVPPYKIGVGTMPTYQNIQSLNVEYYSQCLQSLIEGAEICLDEGLGIGEGVTIDGKVYGTEFDIDGLLRMDTATQMEALEKGKNYLTPDEGRRRINLKPTPGGGVVYRQQQDFSLAALAKRDAQDDPFAKEKAPAPNDVANDNAMQQQASAAMVEILKGLR
jgi:HK97 family phage portal protein